MTQPDQIENPSAAQPESRHLAAPCIDNLHPACALPLATIEISGTNLGPVANHLPIASVDDEQAHVLMSRSTRLALRVPGDASTGMLEVRNPFGSSNAVPLRVARGLTDGIHPITSPAVSASGMIFTTISGPRGKQTPVSIVRVSPDGRGTPFVSEILNASGLAFNPAGDLFVTSRAEGMVYSVDATGQTTIYAEGMGVATGAAFDVNGDLFVGDRSGTIFRINAEHQIFVHATMEPSVSAYHLAVTAENELLVAGPTLSSNETVWRIDSSGEKHVYYQGLGRPQGLAIDADGDLYVAASLRGQRGIVRISNKPNERGERAAELVVAGLNLVGIAFSPLGTAILATNQALYEIDLGVEGLRIF
jgi:sugar lactone lactonase YvrE